MSRGLADVLDTPTGVVDRAGLAERRALDIAYLEGDRGGLARAQAGARPALAKLARRYEEALEAEGGPTGAQSALEEAREHLARWAPQGWRRDRCGRARRRDDGRSAAEIAYTRIERLRSGGPGGRRGRAPDALVWAARMGGPQGMHASGGRMVE